jgi:lipopolysaccharide transport system permease protein
LKKIKLLNEGNPLRTNIKANQPWWRIDWKEIWEYRDLLRLLVWRNFTAVYKQSVLGPLWFLIQPLATTLVFTIIFGKIAKIGTDGIPPFVFYMSGMILWNYFSGCMNGSANSLIGNAGLFQKVYFPRLIVPISNLFNQMIFFLLNLAIFVAFYLYFLLFTDAQIHPSLWILALPLLVLQSAVVGTGVGLCLSTLTVKYRDVSFLLPFLTQLWMYATPIIYPSSSVPEQYRFLYFLNPMASVIEFSRYAFFGMGIITKEIVIYGIITGILLLVTGLLLYNKVQRSYVDTV